MLSTGVVPARAATIIWENSATNFNAGANWVGGTAPGAGDIASFQAATASFQPQLTANISVSGLEFIAGTAAWTFSGNSGTRTLTIGTGGILNNSSNTQTFNQGNLAIALSAAATFSSNGTGGLNFGSTLSGFSIGANLLTLSGTSLSANNLIAEAISGSGGIAKTGSGLWTLSGNSSGMTGNVSISAGTLRATTSANALGTGTLTLAGGELELAHTANLNFGRNTTVTANATITADRTAASATSITHTLGTLSIGTQTLTIDRGANVTGSGIGGITFGATTLTGDATFSTSANTTLTLGALNDGGVARSITKSGTGSLTLTGAATSLVDGTSVNISAGTLNSNQATALGSLALVNLSTGATFGVGAAQTIGGLSGTGGTVALTNALTIGNAANNLTTSFGGTFTGTGALIKAGSGTLTLTGSSSRTGVTSINDGVLEVNTFTNGGSASSIGSAAATASNLTFDGGTLRHIGSAASSNRLFQIGLGGATIDASGSGGLTFTGTGALTFGGSGARSLTLTGSSAGSLAAVIGDSGGATSVTKSGTGSWTLNQIANTYTGATTINGGILSVSRLANIGSNSSIGRGDNASDATNAASLVIDGGTLRYTGGLVTTNRLFTIGSGGATIDSGGTGGMTFNNTGSLVASGTGNRTLTLVGGNTGTNFLYSNIVDPTVGATSLVKTGSGTWELRGNSSFTGSVDIQQGMLIATTSNNALGVGTAGVTVANNATLALRGGVSVSNGTLSLVGTGASGGGALTNVNGNNAYLGNLTLTGNALITTQSGVLTLGTTPPSFTPSGDTEATESGFLTIGGHTLTFSGNGTGIFVNQRIRDFAGQTAGTTYDFPPLTLMGAPETTNPGNVVINMTGGGYVHYYGNANSYTGSTTVQAGTLILDTITNAGAPHDPNTASFHAINGALIIGDGTGAANSAVVQLGSGGSANEIIAHTSAVTLFQDGLFNVNNQAQTIDALTFNGGNVTLGFGTLYLNNDVTVNASAGNTATISGAGSLSLTLQRAGGVDTGPDATRTFTVHHGTGNTYDLIISSAIQNGNLVKAGNGVMMLNANNDYTGYTSVTAGILNIQMGTNGSQKSGLGSGNGSNAQGTFVNVDANTLLATGTTGTLQLQGGIAITTEMLHLAGTGYTGMGALNNLSGTNTWGTAGTTRINLAANSTISTTAGQLNIASDISSSANHALTLSTAAGSTINITGGINTGSGSTTTVTKTGDGTAILAGNSGYQGATNVQQGILSVQHNFGLGAVSTGSNGTFVTSGAELQLSNATNGNLSIGAESLTINGAGIGGASGALNNVAGNNTFAGIVTLGSASTIRSTSGTMTIGGTSSANHALTITGSGNTTVSGNMANGSGTLTKTGSGTFTFAGAAGTVGQTTLSAGVFSVGGTSTLNTGAFGSSAGTTLLIASGGRVISNYASGTTIFSGALSGSGEFRKDGAGTLAFNNSFSATGLTLTLNGGTLSLNGQFTFGTIHITGNTVLDFNNSAGTFLSSANLIIDAGVTVTVNNWVSVANNSSLSTVWYATNTVNGGTLGGTSQVGGVPLNQITFTNYGGLTTTWVSGTPSGWFDREIRPTPEPSTYGAIFVSGCLALLGWRRYRNRKPAA